MFESAKKNFDTEKAFVADQNTKSDDIVTLNVGGEKTMQVSRTLLTKVKGSSLEAMFSGRHTVKKVKDNIFVDRDADVFTMVISYLRNGLKYPTIDDKVLNDRFKQELNYWMLEEPRRGRESVS